MAAAENLRSAFNKAKDFKQGYSNASDRRDWAKAVGMGKYACLAFAYEHAQKAKETHKKDLESIIKELDDWMKVLAAIGLAEL